jgi:hypothetical protein
VLAPPVGGGIKDRYVPLASLVAGTTLGGLLTGGVLVIAWYALAPFDAARAAVVLGVGGIAVVAVVWSSVRSWLPEAACQVPAARMAETMHHAAFRWGVELGAGVCTFAVTPALYAVFAVAPVQHEPALAAAVAGLYGCSRGAAIAWFATVNARRELNGEAGAPGVGLERAMRLPLVIAIVAAAVMGVA